MQRHCGEGSCVVVAFSVWWRLPPFCFVFSVLSPRRHDVYKCVLVGVRCSCIISSTVVVYSSVRYSGAVVLRSQSNWSVSGFPC
jgi:hypothetical protein